jgi:hypothetical protein
MKKTLVLLLLTEVHAIEMTDYRTIYGKYDEAYVHGTLHSTTGNQEQTGYDLKLQANTKTIYTTAPYSFEFTAEGNTNFTQSEDKNVSNTKAYDLFTTTRYDKYLDYDETFMYTGTDLGYRKVATSDNSDKAFLKISTGLGYGRMYDATPLAITLRIMEELKEFDVIKKSLNDIQMLDFAKVIGTKNDYISKYGEIDYKTYWFRDIEEILIDAGVLTYAALGAVGVIKIEEIIEIEKIAGRFHGWKVRAGIGQILSSYDGENESTTIDAEFSYGLPIGYEAQYTENAHISKNLDNTKPINFQFENNMQFTYEISDLIDWENSWDLGIDFFHEGDNIMYNRLSTGFRYYLANNLTLDTTISLEKTDGTNGNIIETKEWDGDLFIGVRYRLK